MHAPDFEPKLWHARKLLLQDLISRYPHKSRKGALQPYDCRAPLTPLGLHYRYAAFRTAVHAHQEEHLQWPNFCVATREPAGAIRRWHCSLPTHAAAASSARRSSPVSPALRRPRCSQCPAAVYVAPAACRCGLEPGLAARLGFRMLCLVCFRSSDERVSVQDYGVLFAPGEIGIGEEGMRLWSRPS